MIKIYRVNEGGWKGLWCTAENGIIASLILDALKKTYPDYEFITATE